MGTFSIWHIMIVILLVVLLFGRGKISDLMGDIAKGIRSFKKGMSDDDEPKSLDHKKTIDSSKVRDGEAAARTEQNHKAEH
jgi:sec-independent protein translocase protein TatA